MRNSDDIDRACEKLTAFLGNRNQDEVYYHRHSLNCFILSHGAANQLLQVELVHDAGCRAPGIVDLSGTGDFLQLIEGDEVYLSLNHRIGTTKTKFSQWPEDVTNLRRHTATTCNRLLTAACSSDAKWPYPAKACFGIIMNYYG